METSTLQISSYLTFRLNDEIFAAGVDKVLEILEIPKITHVPRSPGYMRGVINLRGNVLPVIDTRSKFGLSSAEDTVNTCIIVMNLEIDGQPISMGAIVDAVQEVMEIDENAIQPAPSVGSRYKADFIRGMVKFEDRFIMMLNLDRVFSGDEMSLINEFSDTEKN